MIRFGRHIKGFSLIELTIVLLVVGMLFSGMVAGFARYVAQARVKQVRADLQLIKEALYGYTIQNGHFPCSDQEEDGGGSGVENRIVATGVCADDFGFLPSSDLGVPMLDPWGRRYYYAVDDNFSTSVPFDIDAAGSITVKPDSASGDNVATGVVAFIFSPGPNRIITLGDGSANEDENLDDDDDFVSKDFSPDYDDIATWISTPVIIAKMVDAEVLP